MTPTEKYEAIKHKLKDTPAERISFMRALIALHGDQLSDEQIDGLEVNIKLAQEQEEQHANNI